MAVIKRKDIDWQSYLRELVMNKCRISEYEKIELAGYLLRRDMQNPSKRKEVIDEIVCYDKFSIGDFIAEMLINESPDTIDDLSYEIKKATLDYYRPSIELLISAEEEAQEREKIEISSEHPDVNYNPNHYGEVRAHG